MLPLGNSNKLTYDPRQARRSPWAKPHREKPGDSQPAAGGETQLLREHHWSGLAVQVFEEPAFVAPVMLAPPRQIRLLLLLSGAMRLGLTSAGRQLQYDSTPGTIKLTTHHQPPYEMQWATLTATPVRTAHLYLPEQLLTQAAEAAGLNTARIELAAGSAIPDAMLYLLGRTLVQEAASPAARGPLYGETAAQLLAAQLLRQHCVFAHELPGHRGRLPTARLRQVREYVQAHLRAAIRLEELAALACLSPYHFCRVFKRTTGLSPNQFVICQRLEKAVALLRHSDLNVGEVAAAVGYASHPHFTHLFVRHTGRLPTDYRPGRPG